MWGVSLIRPVLASFLFSFYLGSFCHTSCTGFIFMWGVSLTHPELASFLCWEFLLHIPCWFFFSFFFLFFFFFLSFFSFYLGSFSYTSRAGFIFSWGVSLIHPSLLDFSVGSFSYTSHALFFFFFFFFFSLGEFLLHIPCCHLKKKKKKKSGEFPLHIPCWLFCCCVCLFVLVWGVSLTHPVLASYL